MENTITMNNQIQPEEQEEKIIKCEIMLSRIFFPKGKWKVESGEYAIFASKITTPIENCEKLQFNAYSNELSIKLKGNVCTLEPDVVYKVHCRLADINEKYGNTYEILFINRKVDLSSKSKQMDFLEGILQSSVVTQLFETYEDVIGLLENKDIKALTKIKGIGNAKAMKIIQEYEDSKDYSYIYTELKDLNLSSNLIKKLIDFYKSPDTVVDIIKNNPYRLVEMDGIGFKKADEIAQKVGITGNNPRRVRACMLHTLGENGEAGRSFLHFEGLMRIVYEQIGYIEQEVLNQVAQELIVKKSIIVSNDGQFIGLKKYYDLEMNIYRELMRINNGVRLRPFDLSGWEDRIKQTEEEQGYEFTDEQKMAIESMLKSKITVLTGSGGTGKSSTLKGDTDVLNRYDISACAMSGKASVRITEATGLEASTIHRLLGYRNGNFTYNEEEKLLTDVVILDEATMVNGTLFLALLVAIPDSAKLIIVGDIKQLTPIGNCQVFKDVLESNGGICTIELTKIHRQASASGIITTSLKAYDQEQLFNSTFEGKKILGELQDMELDIYKVCESPSDKLINHFLKHYQITGNLLETQIIVLTKTRGEFCTYGLNNKIQAIINPINDFDEVIELKFDKDHPYRIKIGDKVLNTKNNYKAINTDGEIMPVFNGNVGIVKEIEGKTCVVDFVGLGEILLDSEGIRALELAYAMTTHKCQGSAFKRCIIGMDSSAYKLLYAEMLYTALSRAKEYCVLVGQNKAVRTAISKREVKTKQTYLKYFLMGQM